MSELKSSVALTTFQNLSQVLLCQHVKSPPQPPPNFVSPTAGCHKDVYIAICSPNLFSPATVFHKNEYMASYFPRKNLQFCPPPPTQKKSSQFCFAYGVYGRLRTCTAGTIYQISTLFSNSSAGKNFRPFLGRYLSQKKTDFN
jgi:hypothetical protein